ncbi:LuxR C-terminal-related transcriptional regulator [Kutzneria sp. CA-103260]|uniref:LuxR C-terminal-related transcriptional regulator n=1 Tax=Kutzneria sp. CA-103260 TaxID=2802641 RepID=UPI001BAC6F67|nr:LuxR C-terminal-related transcriptional regulator [Kutzneria sp. CA-103260]QUQ64813.1 HTH-type transcriptional regulator MalT [Kutzneria sp. CA-103260]
MDDETRPAERSTGAARNQVLRGRLSRATELAARAVATAAQSVSQGHSQGQGEDLPAALAVQAWAAAWRGDSQLADQASARAMHQLDAGWTRRLLVELLGARLHLGDVDGCQRLATVAGVETDPVRVAPVLRPWVCESMVNVELTRSRPARAALWAEHAAETSQPAMWGHTGLMHLANGQVALARNDLQVAQLRAGRAAEAFTDAGMPGYAARSHAVVGAALIGMGERDAALRELSAARRLAESCGARALAAELVDAQLGLSVRRAPQVRSMDTLTVREHEVAELAVRGLTNRQIAEKLVVSVKTVEGHLSRVFTKLGVPCRTALAAPLRKIDAELVH